MLRKFGRGRVCGAPGGKKGEISLGFAGRESEVSVSAMSVRVIEPEDVRSRWWKAEWSRGRREWLGGREEGVWEKRDWGRAGIVVLFDVVVGVGEGGTSRESVGVRPRGFQASGVVAVGGVLAVWSFEGEGCLVGVLGRRAGVGEVGVVGRRNGEVLGEPIERGDGL